jgi:inorganic pyrophosphatase
MSPKGSLADPSKLKPTDKDDPKLIRVVIETPAGSRNKYALDEKEKIFALKKVLPAGMTFPHSFGFVPSTKAEDGDPFDVLILMDEPGLQGCLVTCRAIGIIEAKQGEKKKLERNDRIIAIEQDNHEFAHIKHIDDLGKQFIKELETFFVNYHALSGEEYHILDAKGPKEARRRLKQSMRKNK